MTGPTPFVKWAGGKSQLIPCYEPYLPAQFERYVEGFVGGGALYFHLYRQGRLTGKHTVLLDSLQELIDCYCVIRDQVEELILALQDHESHKREVDYFYQVRAWDRSSDYARRSSVQRAARFLFLNHTCYNGLYRVNRRGWFNAPFGRYANPAICDADNLRAVSRALRGVTLHSGDFERCLDLAQPGDFVYLDPPYHPLSATASFTSYTSADFGVQDQRRLASVFRELDRRGCRVMLSNSDTELIRELYAGYERIQVVAARAINSRPDRRGPVSELLVLNRPWR